MRSTTGCMASARLAWPALARLRAMGKDPAPALEEVSLDPKQVEDPDHRMPEEVLDALWVACAALSGDEAFGLRAGLAPSPGQLGVVEYVMRNHPTLGEAMEAGLRFQRVLHDAGADRLSVEGDRATLHDSLASRREPAGVLVVYGFAGALAGAMFLTAVPGRALEVDFVHAEPADPRPWVQTFQCPLRFGAERNRLVFRRDRLDAPIPQSDPGLLPILEQHAQSLLGEAGDSFARRVSERIAEELTGGTPTAEIIAAKLHMSARTLARRLGEEDTSFSALLDHLREQLAISHLRDRDLSVGEVAFLLGFSDANAFSRAFKRWTGAPPSHYRRGV